MLPGTRKKSERLDGAMEFMGAIYSLLFFPSSFPEKMFGLFRTFSLRQFTMQAKRNQQNSKVPNILDDVREVEDVSLGVRVGRLVGLQGEGAVVEGQPPEVHVVGVVEAPRRLLAAPLVLPFCGGNVAAERFDVLNLLCL